MANREGAHVSASQLPEADAIHLDHVGHFVADPGAAADALRRAGFTPTPVSVQVNPDPAGGPARLTGTGNICAMLRAGYLEVLYKTADTPLGAELEQSRARYSGMHLVAFAVADAEAAHRRIAGAGFAMQPLVRMQRPVETADGAGVAAFEVVRVAPGEMPEGRVQMLRHKTEDTVWQPRWLDHPNGAVGLAGLTIVVADVEEAERRFARFLGRSAVAVHGGEGNGVLIGLERGFVELLSVAAWGERWPDIEVPGLPFMGACTIEVESLDKARRSLERGGLVTFEREGVLYARFPEALGHGLWAFCAGS